MMAKAGWLLGARFARRLRNADGLLWMSLGMAVAIAVFGTYGIFPISHQLLFEQDKQSDLQQRVSSLPASSVSSDSSPLSSSLATSLSVALPDTVQSGASAIWPSIDKARDFSAQLSALLKSNQLAHWELSAGKHSASREQQNAVHELSLNLEGRYVEVTKFLSEVLSRYPNVAITSVQLHRHPQQVGLVECVVALEVYYAKRAEDSRVQAQ